MIIDKPTTTTDNITDSTDKRFVTDAQLVVIGNTSGVNTGDQNLSGYALINGSTSEIFAVSQLEIGNASDTTLTRVSAGVAAIEGKNIALNGTTETLIVGTIELGDTSDTTLSRSSAGVIAVEGVTVPLNSTTSTHIAGTIELGNTSDTTLSRSAAGTLAVEGVDVLTTSNTKTLSNKSISGALTLEENASIALDPAGSADGKYSGITVTGTAGYAQTYGDLVYLDTTDSRWEKTDANSASGADGDARGILGIVVVAGAADGNACTILLNGIVRADAAFPTFTVNNPIYVSETAGAVTQTQPTTTDVVIRIVGFALTSDELYFSPDNTYTTHT